MSDFLLTSFQSTALCNLLRFEYDRIEELLYAMGSRIPDDERSQLSAEMSFVSSFIVELEDNVSISEGPQFDYFLRFFPSLLQRKDFYELDDALSCHTPEYREMILDSIEALMPFYQILFDYKESPIY